MGEPARKLDPELDKNIRPDLTALEGGGESTPERANLKSVSDDDLQAAEAGGETPEKTSAETKEAEAADPDHKEGGFYKPSNARKAGRSVGRFSRRQKAMGGGVVGFIVVVVVFLSSILQGPAQMLHISELMDGFHFTNNSRLMDTRAGKIIRWARYRNQPERRRMGFLGNKLGDHYEKKFRTQGMEIEYKGGTANRISAIIIDPTTPAGATAHAKMLENGANTSINPDGRVRVDLEGQSAEARRTAIKGMIGAGGLTRTSSSVAGRFIKIRAGVNFHPMNNLRYAAGESYLDYRKRVIEERTKNRNGGAGADTRKVNGEPDDGSDSGKALDEFGNEIDDIDSPDQTGKQFGGKFDDGSNVIGIACGIYALGKAIPAIKYAKVILPLIRIGMNVVATGAQVKSGQGFNIDELGMLSEDLYDAEKKTSWASARSVQAELGQAQSGPDMPLDVNTNTPAFFSNYNATIDKTPGGTTACNAANSTAGGYILDGINYATTFTGVGGLIKTFVIDAVVSQVASNLVGKALNSAIVGAKNNAKGAVLGNYINYGSKLSANDGAISHGGIKLGKRQRAELRQARDLELKNELRSQSFFGRYLDINEPRSLIASTVFDNPTISSIAMNPTLSVPSLLRAPANIFSGFGAIFAQKTYAADEYDYGFDEYGFSEEEINDDAGKYDNPYENAEKVEPNLAGENGLNEKYGKPCFGVTINPETGKIQSEGTNGSSVKRYDEIDKEGSKCTDRNNVELTQYRYYLLDLTTTKALACFEGIDESACNELGFGAQSDSSAPPSGAASPANGAKGTDTSAQTCKVGTDAGVGVSPDPNIKIRLCNVEGTTVNVAIENNVKIIKDGGKAAGLSFGGGGYRSNARQIELRRQHCGSSQYDIYEKPSDQCKPPTARPGNSMHEWGLAVDFTCGGSLIRSKSSPCFQWLANNQLNHNLKNLPSEAWHWSSNGK